MTPSNYNSCWGLLILFATFTTIVGAAPDAESDPRRRPPDARPLRPALSISDRILPIQLVDTTGSQYVRVPKTKNLRPTVLLAMLGADFNPTFMAQNPPTVLIEEPGNASGAAEQEPSASDIKLTAELKNLNLSTELVGVSPEAVRAMEAWLLAKASCPVRYVWDDVGPLFWPRWIKRGECVNERACSWPEGQRCVPAESVTVHLLRWHCRARKGAAGAAAGRPRKGSAVAVAAGGKKVPDRRSKKQGNMYRCQWLKVPYPVTAECFCSC